MSTPTYTLINQITLAANSSSATFSSIPQNYRDLIVVISGIANSATLLGMQVNADTGTNYFNVNMKGFGQGVFSSANNLGWNLLHDNDTLSGGFYQCNITWMDYSATDKHKTSLTRSSQGNVQSGGDSVLAFAGRWANTSAITSMRFFFPYSGGSTFAAGTSFSLYGIVG